MEEKLILRLTFNPGLALGAVSRKPRKLFGPGKSLQILDYRAVLFTYFKDEERFPSHKKFQAYIRLRFWMQMI